jgi:D-3-phosphoglycerate dehydrogenase
MSSNLKVAVTDYVFPNLDPEREILSEIGAELVAGQSKTREDVVELVRGAHAVLNTYYGPIDGAIMDLMPDCRIIVRYGIGVDTIDISAAAARGIMVANVPDYCIDEVSDHAIAMLLSLLRKLPQADGNCRKGEWAIAPLKPLHRISDLTVGIVGMGRIGRAILSKVSGFGSKIVFFDPYVNQDVTPARRVELAELLEISDAIILQAPATPETHHMLNDKLFESMKRSPVIINCARGELIDTNALIKALETGKVSGAGLDIVEGGNILADHPLFGFDNVIITPHSAWLSDGALKSLQQLAAMEVVRALKGERPISLLNPEVVKKTGKG